jgi:hypothetical protein
VGRFPPLRLSFHGSASRLSLEKTRHHEWCNDIVKAGPIIGSNQSPAEICPWGTLLCIPGRRMRKHSSPSKRLSHLESQNQKISHVKLPGPKRVALFQKAQFLTRVSNQEEGLRLSKIAPGIPRTPDLSVHDPMKINVPHEKKTIFMLLTTPLQLRL